MDAICIHVKQWLFLNSTSFIQMNDGPWYSALWSNINIHQRPAPLTKSENHQHLLFKWQTAAAGVEHTEGTREEKVDKPIQISIRQRQKAPSHQSNEKRQLHWSKHTRNAGCSECKATVTMENTAHEYISKYSQISLSNAFPTSEGFWDNSKHTFL